MIILIIYLGMGAILFYIGPWETRKVKQNLKKNPVDIVVSLTTTPYGIDNIKPVLDSIFRQSIKPNRVYVNIPNTFKFGNNIKYVIPDWLKNYPNIIINRTKDYGPLTKLIGALEKEHDPNTIIITLDDNKIYARHIVRDLAKQYLPGTYKVNFKMGSAITGKGVNILFGPKFELEYNSIIIGNRPSLIVWSADGVAYKRKFFKDDIFSLTDHLPASCFLSDDLMISGYLNFNRISIVKIASISYNYSISKLLYRESSSTLDHSMVNTSRCMAALPAYHKNEYQKAILQRSKIIYSLSQNEIFCNYITQLYYNYLNKMIHKMPFMEKIIVGCMV